MSLSEAGKLKARQWQTNFRQHYAAARSKGQANFLLVATPGAGKTIAQLIEAANLLERNTISWITICVPSDNLRKQWSTVGHRLFGLDLYAGLGFCPSDYHGEVITYAQLAANPGVWEQRCATEKVMLIADEVHHLGDEATWGVRFERAFAGAKYRLLSSGTPFRSDKQFIPWVTYLERTSLLSIEYKSKPDYIYGYGEALKDGVCRHIVFPSYDGQLEWIPQGETESVVASFEDELNDKLSSERLRTAIDPDGQWVPFVLKDAWMRLKAIRKNTDHKNAAGVIICKDDAHARKTAEMLQQISQTPVLLVTNKVQNASELIAAFAKEVGENSSFWIVAVKMVSEGIDIPRLRVGVYLTNITTEMFVKQAIGRVIRVVKELEDDQTAYFYFPKAPEFIKIISAIKEERDHIIEQDLDDLPPPPNPPRGNNGNTSSEAPFTPLNSTAQESDYYYGDMCFSVDQINHAKPYAKSFGIPEAKAAALITLLEKENGVNSSNSPYQNGSTATEKEEKTKYERKEQMKRQANRLIYRLAKLTANNPSDDDEVIELCKQFHTQWKKQNKLTEEELFEKITYVQKEIKRKTGK